MSTGMFWFVQAVGLLGSLIVIAAMQVNSRRAILLCQLGGSLCWIFHYGMLGAVTAVYTNFISMGRSVVFVNNDKSWAKSRLWLWFFIALYLLNSALTWVNWMSLLPAAAMTLTTLALWSRNMRLTRLLMLCNSPFWLAYDLWSRSYSCALVEIIAFCSFAAALYRFDLRKSPAGGCPTSERSVDP